MPVRSRRRAEWVRGEQQLLPRLAARAGVDLVHSLANTGPSWGHFRRVVTIHDLHYRLVPEAHLGLRGLGMRVLVPLAARRSDRIIAVSQSTRSDLVRLSKSSLGQGRRGPAGDRVAAGRRRPAPGRAAREVPASGSGAFVLCVAAKRPHKNLIRLLGALALIPSDRRPVLVLPGYPTSHEQDLRRCARRARDRGRRATPGVGRSGRARGPVRVGGLFRAAVAARGVRPAGARGDGPGAPGRVLEPGRARRRSPATRRCTSTLTPRRRSAPRSSACSETRREAERLAAAGRERAAQFSWAATAAGTLACYERTLHAAISSCAVGLEHDLE